MMALCPAPRWYLFSTPSCGGVRGSMWRIALLALPGEVCPRVGTPRRGLPASGKAARLFSLAKVAWQCLDAGLHFLSECRPAERRICRSRSHPAPAHIMAVPYQRFATALDYGAVGLVAVCRVFDRYRPFRSAAFFSGHKARGPFVRPLCGDHPGDAMAAAAATT
jgi:hypothetical protein